MSGNLNFGNGAPIADLGDLGDGYVDTSAASLYGPKTVGGWGAGTNLGGVINYVDFSGLSPVPMVAISPLTGTDKFDFSSFSSLFSHKPRLLRCIVRVGVSLAANTDMAYIEINDTNATGTASGYDVNQVFTSVGGSSASTGFTADLIPFDFDGETTFNIWLNTNGPSLTVGNGSITMLGYFY